MHIVVQIFDFLIKECQMLPHVEPTSTGPTIRSSDHNIALAYNFYSDFLETIWDTLGTILEHFIHTFNSKSEFILHNGCSGEIIDSGYHSFHIKQSRIIEAYFYEQELFLYVRVLWESHLQHTKTHLPDEWISLDVDVVLKSAWFVEKKLLLQDVEKKLL